MKQLAKSIVNYFATYNETRFNFKKKIIYAWSENEFSLDVNIFCDFSSKVFALLSSGKPVSISIEQNEYKVEISSDVFVKKLREYIYSGFKENIVSIVASEGEYLQDELREANLALRKVVREIILKLQKEKIDEIELSTKTKHIPISNLNVNIIEQQIYDEIALYIKFFETSDKFFEQIDQYLANAKFELVIFDLYSQLFGIEKYRGTDNLYMFFQEIAGEENKYPLYFLEISLDQTVGQVPSFVISNVRDVVMLNVPAVNSFSFDRVLTLQRSSTLKDFDSNIKAMERYLASYYKTSEQFAQQLGFNTLVAENLPTISPRIGFQIIQKEEKSVLDYSEIITKIDGGESEKFISMVSDYVDGNVENTTDAVHEEYEKSYPTKSVKSLVHELPIPLNKPQKKIVTAVNNPKNKIIVVDGPPGTGKSYTITALVYNAVRQKKCVVITSHKTQALDVVEEKLTEQFKKLHPKAKPTILRLTFDKEKSSNCIENTLSSPVLSHANQRKQNIDKNVVQKDLDRYSSELSEKVENVWKFAENAEEYDKKQKRFFELIKNLNLELVEIPIDELNVFSKEEILTFFDKLSILSAGVSADGFVNLLCSNSNFEELVDHCDYLHKYGDQSIVRLEMDLNEQLLIEFEKDIVHLGELVVEETRVGDIKKGFSKFKNLGFLGGFKKSVHEQKLVQCEKIIDELKSLRFHNVVQEIERVLGKRIDDTTVENILGTTKSIKFSMNYFEIETKLSDIAEILGLDVKQVGLLYERLEGIRNILGGLDCKKLSGFLQNLQLYRKWIEQLGANLLDLSTLTLISSKYDQLAEAMVLFGDLSKQKMIEKPDQNIVEEYNLNLQKLVENENDTRFVDLMQHSGDIGRILNAVSAGKRIHPTQAKVLLEHMSCIIAPPSLISKNFPMEEDIIDTLVIDEGSQVSIADSISLILRAKQTVVFGDELQYGAVGAMNVSKEYSSQYFREILDKYSEDRNDYISDKDKDRIVADVSASLGEEDEESSRTYTVSATTKEWLKTFSVRTSTLSFCKSIANYSDSLNVHFRSFPEIIGYSNEFFYKESQTPLVINRIRTKPIENVLEFVKVDTQGFVSSNVNLDEIELIKNRLEDMYKSGSQASVGVICSFKEQTARMEEELRKYLNGYHEMVVQNKLRIWFVGDVQGEERDVIFYSFVQDKNIGNADLRTIYPVVGGTADNIRKLKKQRLNVGFSRAKDKMVFVHSMPIEDYSDTVLGEALKYYLSMRDTAVDNYVEDESVFGSPAEREVYMLLQSTAFFQQNVGKIKVVAQFPIGKYLADEFKKYIPDYRVDFLIVYSDGASEKTLILEYDGLEYHFKDARNTNKLNYSSQYTEYDIQRQIELESYGYKFLRLNKFNLMPVNQGETKVDVLNKLLIKSFEL